MGGIKQRDRGMVTAELAVLIPFGFAFGFLLLWIVSLGVTQVRLVDTSREAARLLARGDAPEQVRDTVLDHAPEDTRLQFTTDDGLVTVTATATSQLALTWFDDVGAVQLKAVSVSSVEGPQ